jgi:hypothetical protein
VGLIAAAAALALAAPASAATFEVSTLAATSDPLINGICDVDPTADVDCTFAAAIDESNGSAAADSITFNKTDAGGDPDDVVFNAAATSSQVSLGTPYPTITDGVTIDAGNCNTDPANPNLAVPCAELDDELPVDSQGEVSVKGFAFTGTGGGIHVAEVNGETAAPDFLVQGSWFGINVDGSKSGVLAPATSVLLEDVDGARIGGGDDPGQVNTFARHGATGIDVFGADNTRIEGNVFGEMPDGTFARAGEGASSNGDNIEVTGDDNGNANPADDDVALGTAIGARSVLNGTTPACESFCNKITRAGIAESDVDDGTDGIDLGGESGQNEVPAENTVIRGNQVGGSAGTNGRNATGIDVGGSDGTEIGGPAAGGADRNVLSGNEVRSGTAAQDLLIQGNFVGLNPAGTVLQGDSSSPVLLLNGSGSVLGNQIANVLNHPALSLPGTAIPGFAVRGNFFGETVSGGQALSGSPTIQISGSGHTIGGAAPGAGNLLSTPPPPPPPAVPTITALQITGDGNDVLGNRIGLGSGGQVRPYLHGVSLAGDADGNQIGGDDAGSENVISNSAGDAIQVTNANSDGNLIARNVGTANGGLFIDLGNDGTGNTADPTGPNDGAQAPTVTAVGATAAQGTAAPGATIRVFTKADASAGELEGFLADATADGAGNWQAMFAEQPNGRLIAATATSGTSTSELSAPAAVPEPPPEDGGGGDGGGDAGGGGGGDDGGEGGGGQVGEELDTDPPETIIAKRPKNRITKPKAKYAFRADEPGSTFRCGIDKKSLKPCTSPRKLKKLKDGKHRFKVFAVDPAGNVDPTPAKDRFKVS